MIGGVSHRLKHRKANSIIYAGFQEVGPDNGCEEAGEQTMVKSAAEPVERMWSEGLERRTWSEGQALLMERRTGTANKIYPGQALLIPPTRAPSHGPLFVRVEVKR